MAAMERIKQIKRKRELKQQLKEQAPISIPCTPEFKPVSIEKDISMEQFPTLSRDPTSTDLQES